MNQENVSNITWGLVITIIVISVLLSAVKGCSIDAQQGLEFKKIEMEAEKIKQENINIKLKNGFIQVPVLGSEQLVWVKAKKDSIK